MTGSTQFCGLKVAACHDSHSNLIHFELWNLTIQKVEEQRMHCNDNTMFLMKYICAELL